MRGAERVHRAVRRHPEQIREKAGVGLAGQHRGRRDHPAVLGRRQRRHPVGDQRRQRGRHRGRAEPVDDLLHQERQAVGAGHYGVPGVGRKRLAGAQLGQRHHVGRGKPIQPYHLDVAAARQRAQNGRRFLVAGRGHDRDRGAGDHAREVGDQCHGVGVGPVQVVQQQRRAARRQRPQQSLAEHQGRIDQRLRRTGRRPVRAQPAERRQVRPQLGGVHRSVQPPDRPATAR